VSNRYISIIDQTNGRKLNQIKGR